MMNEERALFMTGMLETLSIVEWKIDGDILEMEKEYIVIEVQKQNYVQPSIQKVYYRDGKIETHFFP